MSVVLKILLVIALFIAVVILNTRLYEHRLDPPGTDKDAKLHELRRYDAAGTRLLPLSLLVDALFLAAFLWLTFEFR